MSLSKTLLKNLQKRDPYCWHCGESETLVPHHRKNRGMGGSKNLDRLDNLLMCCSQYNGDMESLPKVASRAKEKGHKLASWENFDSPVLDEVVGAWYLLDLKGGKVETEGREGLF